LQFKLGWRHFHSRSKSIHQKLIFRKECWIFYCWSCFCCCKFIASNFRFNDDFERSDQWKRGRAFY
jgi:hypothetical protein